MKLSIIILSIPERLQMLWLLINELSRQCYKNPVEIIYFGDNLTKSVGEKRNDALKLAKGEYVAFIDDDDMIKEDYIESLLQAISSGPDVVSFIVDEWYNDKEARYQVFQTISRRCLDPTLKKKYGRPVLTMPPNHLCCWKRELALLVPYPFRNRGEDHIWAESMAAKYKYNHVALDKILYIYKYNSSTSKTQTR